MIDYSKCPKQCELNKKCYQDGKEAGRREAYEEMIDRCNKYSYTCSSSEFAKILKEWLEEDNGN